MWSSCPDRVNALALFAYVCVKGEGAWEAGGMGAGRVGGGGGGGRR